MDPASRLPKGIAETPRREPSDRPGIPSFNDFLFRIAEEEGTSPDDAANEALPRARAATGVILAAVDPDEAGDIRRQFPGEFAPLFE